MININLLPWREEKREQNRKNFFLTLASIFIIFVFVASIIHVVISHRIANQNSRNAYLSDEIKIYQAQTAQLKDLKKSRQDLINRINVIQQLEESRPFTVELFSALSNIFPNNMYLSSITRTDAQLVITGRAESHAVIAKLMRNIEKSSILANPNLGKVDTQTADFPYEFSMTIDIKNGGKTI